MEETDAKKSAPTVKRVRSFKTESETQTAVAVRVPSIKKTDTATVAVSEKLVTAEQAQNASIARRRRIITKNKAQSIRTREKTPEPNRTPVAPPQHDAPSTDEEEPKSPKSASEIESDDIYAEMRRKLQEQKNKDDDDIDIEAIHEARAEEAKERRRRSISPFAIPSKEDIANLQRKGSFIDPDNKLLSTVPNYAITIKDEHNFDARKSSLIAAEDELIRRNSISAPPSPRLAAQAPSQFQLTTPPSPKKTSDASSIKRSNTSDKILEAKRPTQQPPLTKQTTPAQKAPKPCLKPSPTNANETNTPNPREMAQSSNRPAENPPVRPKRSKSGTRSQGRTSESEMSEDQSRPKPRAEVQKVPKPKERRRTIADFKAQPMTEMPPVVKRSKSVTKTEEKLDVTGIEMTKTSSEIIDLLQKVKDRKSSGPTDDELLVSNAIRAYFDNSRQLVTPNKTPSTPKKGMRITSPKKIEILTDKEALQTFKEAQRKSMELERSRHSSGYIDASQSEVTSSCYSGDSSYSEDESDFDLSKKTAELSKKLALLKGEKEVVPPKAAVSKPAASKSAVAKPKPKPEPAKKREKMKKSDSDEKAKEEKTLETKNEPKTEKPIATDKSTVKRMFKNFRPVWRQFKADHIDDWVLLKRMWNRCFSDMMILIIFCGLGGMMFRYTEGAFENMYKCGVRRVKRDFVDALWQSSHNMREEEWKSMARTKLFDFENQLHTAHEAGVRSYSGLTAWSFLNSMVFCLTVVTTIGYGHIAPSTTTGRAITIVYAIFGIPLFLILLADFGKLFTRGIKFLWAFVRRLYMTGSCRKARRTVPVQGMMKGLNMVASTLRRPSQYVMSEPVPVGEIQSGEIDDEKPPPLPPKPRSMSLLGVPDEKGDNADEDDENGTQTPALSTYEIDDEFNLPISVAFVILVLYILAGASIYVFWEEWGFFESFYFVFISMSTIGFGDFVPNHPAYMMGSIVYLIFGLALTSMCINVIQVKLSDSFRQASAKIGATIGLKVSEEDGSLHPVTPPPIEVPAIHNGQKNSENNEEDP